MIPFSHYGTFRTLCDTPYMEHSEYSYNPPPDQERLAELRTRVAQGYYSKPDVLHVIASRLTNDLRGSHHR